MKLSKKVISLAIVLIMLVSLIPTNFVEAAIGDTETNPIKYSPSDKVNFPQAPKEGYVLINKNAEWVQNEDKVAKVTMALEGKGVKKTTDVVLVIDRSSSMDDVITTKLVDSAVPITFKATNVNYQYKDKNNNWHNAPTSATATISMTAFIDKDGVYKGYKKNTLSITGLNVSGAKKYRYAGSGNKEFSTWTSINTNNCADALIKIFNGKNTQVIVDNKSINVTFPTDRKILQKKLKNPGTVTVKEKKIVSAREAANQFVSELLHTAEMKTLNRIAVVSYSSYGYGKGQVFIDSQLNNNEASLNIAINGIVATGGTHIQAGIEKAQELLAASTATNKYIVVLSDGEPTYSYEANGAIRADSSDYNLNFPNNSSYRLSSFSTYTRGNGYNYNFYDYWGYPYGYSVKIGSDYLYVNNNGYPTISQALIAKKSGIEMYSVGFDVSSNENAVYTMRYVASSVDNFYLATDDLTEVFSNIAGKIAKAGTNAKVKNVSGGNTAIGYNFTVMNDEKHLPTATQGIVTVSSDLKTIDWDLGNSGTGGDITETPAVLTYYIKLNVASGKTINPSEVLNTSSSSKVIYKNYLDVWCEKDFPASILTAGTGTINANYYLTDEDGNPINNDGEIISFKDRVLIAAPLNEGIAINTPITVANYAITIGGYINQSTTAYNENEEEVDENILATRTTTYLNFPYYRKSANNLINNTMYPSKNLEPFSDDPKSTFDIYKDIVYNFGFKFVAGQNEPNINLILSGNTDRYILNNFKLYEEVEGGLIPVEYEPISKSTTFEGLNKTMIKEGNTYTITYNLKCPTIMNELLNEVKLSMKVSMDGIGDIEGMNPITVISKKTNEMPNIE